MYTQVVTVDAVKAEGLEAVADQALAGLKVCAQTEAAGAVVF
jgi:hypothetical protein